MVSSQENPINNIALTGLMGSGKSSVGRTIARFLKRQFIDTDYLIEREENKTIQEIFSKKGEPYFRELETKMIKKVLKNKNVVISLGGGAIANDENRKIVKEKAKLVTLLATPEDLIARIKRRSHRPLLKGNNELETLQKLWKERESAYLDSHLQVDTADKEIDEISNEIINSLNIKKVTNYKLKVSLDRESVRYNIRFKNISQLNLSELNLGTKALIVTQEPIAEHYLDRLKKLLGAQFDVFTMKIDDGEEAKNFFTYQLLMQKCLALGLERNDTIIAFGGGVVGDLAGFAASTYLRGINLVQIPTTLLSMIDSSVGGKTGINVDEGKNLIGSFYQPRKVIIDVNFLKTLPEKEYKCGLGELIKYSLLGSRWDVLLGESFFSFLSRNAEKIIAQDTDIVRDTVEHCLKIKSSIVSQDEKEKGIRAHLNLGHTFGHAIEEITKYKRYSHGEAVAIGIVCACRLAELVGSLQESESERVIELMKTFGLSHSIPDDIKTDDIVKAFKRDKKVQDGKVRFVLPKTRIGRVDIFDDIDMDLAKRAIDMTRA